MKSSSFWYTSKELYEALMVEKVVIMEANMGLNDSHEQTAGAGSRMDVVEPMSENEEVPSLQAARRFQTRRAPHKYIACDRCIFKGRDATRNCNAYETGRRCSACRDDGRVCHIRNTKAVIGSNTEKGARSLLDKNFVGAVAASGDQDRHAHRVIPGDDDPWIGTTFSRNRYGPNSGRYGRQNFSKMVKLWQMLSEHRGTPLPNVSANIPDDIRLSPYEQTRFRLPPADLLDAIHATASAMYASHPDQLTLAENGNGSLFYAMDGTALLAIAVLAQELMHELTSPSTEPLLPDVECEFAPSKRDVAGIDSEIVPLVKRPKRKRSGLVLTAELEASGKADSTEPVS
ncbi:hypothetical protein HDU85_000699 [Gaertneriomyces sp. JEL0708]|nr:hypothetical protein HDU85_000699 [Gaertneriomyces sp. JEL0708]